VPWITNQIMNTLVAYNFATLSGNYDTNKGTEGTPTITVLSQALTKVPTLLLRMLEDIIFQQIGN